MSLAAFALAAVITACGSAGGGTVAGVPDPGGDDGIVPPIPAPPSIPLDVAIDDLVAAPGSEDGSVVLRFTAPGETGESAADRYVVLASVRHITAEDQRGASTLALADAPGRPGTAETIVLRGLEAGRTLQFAVRAERGGAPAPLDFGVGARVAGRDVPPPPGNAIRLTGPATLNQSGATYLLTQDVATTGTAFRITAADVTLDLGGHRVTYGGGSTRAFGVITEYPGTSGTITVRNGSLVQNATTATRGHGVFLQGVGNARVSYLDIETTGADAFGVWVTEAENVRVDHCEIAVRTTTVSNRHYPGGNAVLVEEARGTVELDENLVTASPQWGLRVRGAETTTSALIHHNRVIGTKARVANGYMLGVHARTTEVYENELRGESRGIHVDGIDENASNAWIHDNHVEFQDQTNAEYPDRHWGHGIKIEGAPGCIVERNVVRGVADAAHADVYALDVHVGDADGIVVRHNRFQAISTTTTLEGLAVHWTYGASGPSTDIVLQQNVFAATDKLLFRYWDGGIGGLFTGNWWVRDLAGGTTRPWSFEYFWNGDAIPSRGHRFLDAYPVDTTLQVGQRQGAGPYTSTREGTLTVKVTNGSAPVAGAAVTVRDGGGDVVWQGTTNAEGRVAGAVLAAVVTNGPALDDHGPFRVSVGAAGQPPREATAVMRGRAAVLVDVAAGVRPDAPPSAPTALVAHPLSASRALIRWEAATDDVAVATYLVSVDGAPYAITDAPGAFLAGLSPASPVQVTVRAVDAGGQVSATAGQIVFTTPAEDRGP